jgi:riboflavin biosynthesis pyrimidine reductase
MIDRLAKYIPSSSDLEDDEFRARHQIILIGSAFVTATPPSHTLALS